MRAASSVLNSIRFTDFNDSADKIYRKQWPNKTNERQMANLNESMMCTRSHAMI